MNNRIGRLQARRRRSRLRPVRPALGKEPHDRRAARFGDRILGPRRGLDHHSDLRRRAEAQPDARGCRSRRPVRRCQRYRHRRKERFLSPTARSVVRLGDAARGPRSPASTAGITALCALPDGGFAVALGGEEVRIEGGPLDGRRWTRCRRRALPCGERDQRGCRWNARRHRRLAAATTVAHWAHDLMEPWRERPPGLARSAERARRAKSRTGLEYAFGACAAGRRDPGLGELASSARRRRAERPAPRPCSMRLPVYPSRLVAAAGGGFWLTAFAARTQLVEFVLRETAFRRRMMKEIAPEHWIAPRLRSGQSYPRADAGRASAHHGRAEAVGAAALLRPRDPSLARRPRRSIRCTAGSTASITASSRRPSSAGVLYLLAKGPGRLIAARARRHREGDRGMTHADPRAAPGDQALWRRAGDRKRRFQPGRGRDPCAGRRERRRQVHPHQGHGRRRVAHLGHDADRAAARSCRARRSRPASSASPWSSRRTAWCRR